MSCVLGETLTLLCLLFFKVDPEARVEAAFIKLNNIPRALPISDKQTADAPALCKDDCIEVIT